jgi:hypothetical protein
MRNTIKLLIQYIYKIQNMFYQSIYIDFYPLSLFIF